MDVKLKISRENQPIKELTEHCKSDLPSLITAIGKVKETTNEFLTALINKEAGAKGESNINDELEEDEDEDEDETHEDHAMMIESIVLRGNEKRKAENDINRKKQKS